VFDNQYETGYKIKKFYGLGEHKLKNFGEQRMEPPSTTKN